MHTENTIHTHKHTQGSCNVVMAGLVNTLLPLFLRKLGEDYTKWAAEPEYRQKRAQRSMPLNSMDEVQQL